jgi:hypothetical protein
MPSKFFHIDDNGDVNFFTRKCKICKKKWSLNSYIQWPLPDGLGIRINEKTKVKYPDWLYKTPYGEYAIIMADMLPHWKRRTRIIVTLSFALIIVGLIVWSRIPIN